MFKKSELLFAFFIHQCRARGQRHNPLHWVVKENTYIKQEILLILLNNKVKLENF